MLTLPRPVLEMVRREAFPKATPQDVAKIKALMALPVPDSYFELITRYGYLVWDPVDDPGCFKYTYREPEVSMEFEGCISHVMKAARVEQYYGALVLDEKAADVPKFPAFMLPIGLDPDQSHILLECGGQSDRIWFWEFQDERWGEGNNVRLAFVAQTLTDFFSALYIPQD